MMMMVHTPQPQPDAPLTPGVSQLPRADRDRSQDGATIVEWALVVGAVALLTYPVLNMALDALVSYYRHTTTLNALPFP
jgi:hypothetical protein